MEKFNKISKCRLCFGSSLDVVHNFGHVPLGNNYQMSEKLAAAADAYPLAIQVCHSCGHFQLTAAVNPVLLYATNYTYLSGIGSPFVKHLGEVARVSRSLFGESYKPTALEVGCNDGSLLERLAAEGFRASGVDPATLPTGIARAKNLNVFSEFFNSGFAKSYRSKFGGVDLVIGLNVFAHVDEFIDSLIAAREALVDGGYLFVEVGYFKSVIEKSLFDTIYHEHLDYHLAEPLAKALNKVGFSVCSFSENEVQGGSLRVIARKDVRGVIEREAGEFLAAEREFFGCSRESHAAYRAGLWTSRLKEFGNLVLKHKSEGYAIVGYGAPTKASLCLGAMNADTHVDFFVEDNLEKVGKFLPINAVPIFSTSKLIELKSRKVLVIVFAWNFVDSIISKLESLGLSGFVAVFNPAISFKEL